MSDLSQLGQEIAREQDALRAASGDRARVREQLAMLDVAPRVAATPARIRAAIAFAAAAALAMAAAALLFARHEAPAPLALTVGNSAAPVHAGAWIEAGRQEPTWLQFSDGTRVDMAPEARARVVEIDADGAHLLIESGHARVQVVPRADASWRLSVGPFMVRVTGTRFDVRWDPERDAFELDLERGHVEVSGCVFGRGHRLTAGQAVEASCKRGRLHVGQRGQAASDGDEASRTSAAQAQAPQDESAGSAVGNEPQQAANRAPRARSSERARGASRSGWRALAAQGKYGPAFAAAEAAGFENECARADARELAMLADAARYARRPEQEAHALLSLRRRFGGTSRAALAAFALGRIEFDRNQSYEEAAEWFGTYLKEQPGGPLTREARGRLMEATFRSGDADGARDLARAYLREYPAGPHAEIARGLRSAKR